MRSHPEKNESEGAGSVSKLEIAIEAAVSRIARGDHEAAGRWSRMDL
jgi:hypothetical protein